ncbi:hypothetical protein HAX54_005521 [Datura stramonium]|uniref:Cytochrome P450 n=1 Tax=Datura stramonium TaxID=4076 RepID=A0ABS8T8Y1_DATST|nr:hypothetical protein [Datura stramonium]
MSLKLGQITTVVISSSTIAKKVLKYQDQAFSTRFIPNAVQAHNHYKYSVAWLPVCPQWRTLKRILNTNIFSSNRLDANQHLRSQKVKELLAYCAKCSQEGKALDVGQVVFKTNLNLLSNTLFSKDLADPFSDSKLELNDVTSSIMTDAGKSNLVDFFPILEKFDPQEIMKKAQAVLAEIIGKGKPIEETNICKLPYLQFIIKETLRIHPQAPFLVPCKVEQDVELCNYIVPKGSMVLVNVWAIGRDSTFWKDPLVFKPDRFMSLEVDVRGKDFELIPFSAGRRICIGLSLALRMIPLMLGSILNSFN